MIDFLTDMVPSVMGLVVAATMLYGLWHSQTTHCYVAALTALLLLNAWHLDEVYISFGSVPNAAGGFLFVPAMSALMMCAGRHGTQAARQVLNSVCLGLMIFMVTHTRVSWYSLFVVVDDTTKHGALGDVRDTFLMLIKFHFAGSLMLLTRRALAQSTVPRILWGSVPLVGATLLTLPINMYSVHLSHPTMDMWPVFVGTVVIRAMVATFCSAVVLTLVATSEQPITPERKGRLGLG